MAYNNRHNAPSIKLTPDGKLPDFGCQTNQNEIRKGRRRRFASGDRHAFNKHRGNKAGMICHPSRA